MVKTDLPISISKTVYFHVMILNYLLFMIIKLFFCDTREIFFTFPTIYCNFYRIKDLHDLVTIQNLETLENLQYQQCNLQAKKKLWQYSLLEFYISFLGLR